MEKQDLKISYLSWLNNNEKVEGLLFEPLLVGVARNLVVFLHGHMSDCWDTGWVGQWLANNGYYAFVPSQPGYGFSEGKLDFSGPNTVQAIISGVKEVKNLTNFSTIGVWGVSRGAMVAALVCVKETDMFDYAIFQSGTYEERTSLEKTQIPGIREAFIKETGGGEQALKERSPIYDMDKIKCPVLIIHGRKDDRVPVEQAEMLDKKLTELKKPHETIILDEEGHRLLRLRDKHVLPFLIKQTKV